VQTAVTLDVFRHAGFVTASTTQTTTYTFYIGSDDGSLLYIDNALVGNDTGDRHDVKTGDLGSASTADSRA